MVRRYRAASARCLTKRVIFLACRTCIVRYIDGREKSRATLPLTLWKHCVSHVASRDNNNT